MDDEDDATTLGLLSHSMMMLAAKMVHNNTNLMIALLAGAFSETIRVIMERSHSSEEKDVYQDRD